MAKKGPKDIRNISAEMDAISQMQAHNYNPKDYERMLKMRKDFDKLDEQQKKRLKELTQDYKEFMKVKKEIEKQDKASLASKTKLNEQLRKTKEKVADLINPFNLLARGMGAVVSAGGSLVSQIAGFLNPMNLLSTAVNALTALYENWFRLTNLMIGAQGAFARATGAVGAQLASFRDSVNEIQGTFAHLLGTAEGITEAGGFMTDMMVNLRTSTALTADAAREFIMSTRNMGLSANQAASLFRVLDSGVYGTSDSLEEFNRGMMDFADTIDANASTLVQEFTDSRATLALFGEEAVNVFSDAARVANYFGIETARVLQLASRYNSFNNAAQSVNQLNAVFGTTISSMDLLLETNPAERMNMILESVRGVADAASITGPQLQALADSLGVDTDVASRMLSGASMEEINREAEERARSEEVRSRARERAMSNITDLINATMERMESWRTLIDRIMNQLSMSLEPIFTRVYGIIVNVADGLAAWVTSIVNHPEFVAMIDDIAAYFEEMPTNIDAFLPTWEDIRDTALEIWPVVREIGSFLMEAIQFAWEHREAIGIALGVLVVGNLLSSFGALGVLFSPAGAILIGIAAFALAVHNANTSTENLVNRMHEVSNIAPELRTAEENEAIRRGGENALTGIANATAAPRGNSLFRGAGSAAATALGALGFGGASSAINEGLEVTGSTYENLPGLIRSALEGGQSVETVLLSLRSNAMRSRDSAIMIGRALGTTDVREYVENIDREVHPEAYLDEMPTEAPEEPTSAVDTAPSTSTTASSSGASMAAAAAGVETFMAQVLLDGDRVGDAILRRSRRSS